MQAALIFAALLSSQPAIDVDERSPMLMLALTPSGASASTKESELYRVADAALREATTLFIRSPEQAGLDLGKIDACELDVRLTCWVRAVRASSPAFLLVVSIHPLADRSDKLTSLLIDVADAAHDMDRAVKTEAGWEAKLEDRIFERARHAKPQIIRADRPAEVTGYFRRLFREELAGAFEGTHERDHLGAIAISGAAAGLTIELDGRPIGSTSADKTEIRGVTPRTRRVAISDPLGRFEGLARDVDVEPGRTAELTVELALIAPLDRGLTPRKVTMWSGAGVAAIGAALTIYAIAGAPSGNTFEPCTGANCADSSRAFASFCELSSDDPAQCGGGVLAAPLGYSLVLTGATWSLGSIFIADDTDDVPWIPLIAGLVAGGASYAISAAVN